MMIDSSLLYSFVLFVSFDLDLFTKNIRTPPPVQPVAYTNSSTSISYQPILSGAVLQQPINQVQIPNSTAAIKHNKLPPQILPKV